jgi:hypothetical protein
MAALALVLIDHPDILPDDSFDLSDLDTSEMTHAERLHYRDVLYLLQIKSERPESQRHDRFSYVIDRRRIESFAFVVTLLFVIEIAVTSIVPFPPDEPCES